MNISALLTMGINNIQRVQSHKTRQKYNRRIKMAQSRLAFTWHYVGYFSTKCVCTKNRSSTKTSQSREPHHLLWQWPVYSDLTGYGQLSRCRVTVTELHLYENVRTSNTLCSIWSLISSLETLLALEQVLGFLTLQRLWGKNLTLRISNIRGSIELNPQNNPPVMA